MTQDIGSDFWQFVVTDVRHYLIALLIKISIQIFDFKLDFVTFSYL